MGQVPLSLVNNEIESLGEDVTLTSKSDRTYSDWGDETATETDTTSVKAIYNVYTRASESVPEGSFQKAEITFFFKSTQSGVVNGTKVTRANGEVFAIRDTRNHGIEGNIHVIEALVEKI